MSGKEQTMGGYPNDRRREEERELWERINQRMIDSVPKGTMASEAPWKMSVALAKDSELKALVGKLFAFAESGSGYIHDRMQERNPDDPEIADLFGLPRSLEEDPPNDEELFFQEAKRLLEMENPELRSKGVEILENGAEVLRLHYGWSDEELAKQLQLPPDFSAGYVEVKPIHLGQRITELREIVDLTPLELADSAEIPIEVVRLLEEGHEDADPYLDELRKLAEALDTNLAFLCYWAERLASQEA